MGHSILGVLAIEYARRCPQSVSHVVTAGTPPRGDMAWLAGRPEVSIDAFSLSNICELMNIEDTARTFEQVARTAQPHARICFRNLIIPREVPGPLKPIIQLREDTMDSGLLVFAFGILYG